jgi:alpha-acetolactate decarboxylase
LQRRSEGHGFFVKRPDLDTEEEKVKVGLAVVCKKPSARWLRPLLQLWNVSWAWHYVSGSNDHRAGELYQTSLMSALITGIYEGEATYGEIRKHGDFGLGTFNQLDGEMIGFDGTFYQLTNVEGTLAGFRSPTYAHGIGVAGFHLHFLRQDKHAGGHALDFRLRAGKAQICTVHNLRVDLPSTEQFLGTNFEDPALNRKIKVAEG